MTGADEAACGAISPTHTTGPATATAAPANPGLIVAHRLTQAVGADRIIVLDRGSRP